MNKERFESIVRAAFGNNVIKVWEQLNRSHDTTEFCVRLCGNKASDRFELFFHTWDNSVGVWCGRNTPYFKNNRGIFTGRYKAGQKRTSFSSLYDAIYSISNGMDNVNLTAISQVSKVTKKAVRKAENAVMTA